MSSNLPTPDSTSEQISTKNAVGDDDLIDEDALLEPKDLERPEQKSGCGLLRKVANKRRNGLAKIVPAVWLN
uniref:Uncharacterized protein n=1 Tax=Meloidogyne enterolobii TaxID=390850 RepID=A0A6V7WJF8_MELEN|nr:unnamed protein product [Meloidogyne enterolobii]